MTDWVWETKRESLFFSAVGTYGSTCREVCRRHELSRNLSSVTSLSATCTKTPRLIPALHLLDKDLEKVTQEEPTDSDVKDKSLCFMRTGE